MAQPLLAAVVGLALGTVLVILTRINSRSVDAADPASGLARVALGSVARLGAAAAALAVYSFLAPEGLATFGIALVAAFLALAGYEAYRFAGLGPGGKRR